MAAYSFTSQPIALTLLADSKRGVDLKVVVDKSQATARYMVATFLENQAIAVRVDYQYAIMHDKSIIVDGETVEDGGFNFTAAAEKKNAENVLVLRGDLVVAWRLEQDRGLGTWRASPVLLRDSIGPRRS